MKWAVIQAEQENDMNHRATGPSGFQLKGAVLYRVSGAVFQYT